MPDPKSKNKVWWCGLGLILIGSGIFEFFNRTYYNFKYRYLVDVGPSHHEISIITIIAGIMLIIWAFKKS